MFKAQDQSLSTPTFSNMTGSKVTGFTLIELLVTLTILGILIAIATPYFIDMLKSWEARQVRALITHSYRLSKAESYIHHQNIIMCPTISGEICHRDGTDTIIVFADVNANKRFDIGIDNMLSKESLNLDHGRIYLRAGRRHHIKFFGDTGLPRGHFGHIKYCPDDSNPANTYQVSINQLGNHKHKPLDSHPTDCP